MAYLYDYFTDVISALIAWTSAKARAGLIGVSCTVLRVFSTVSAGGAGDRGDARGQARWIPEWKLAAGVLFPEPDL